ncbi:MAG: hypothetical protein H7Z20_10795 [Bdellovibrio sp.]|nr:hypothetical protein [Methylotenera sp.]
MHQCYWCLAIFLLISACEKQSSPSNKAAQNTVDSALNITKTTEETAPVAQLADGIFCFKKELNKDVTNVQLVIAGNEITGFMNSVPYQKDSARGTLKGTKNAASEFDLMYQYMIEGNQQTETKIMKIQNETLWIKKGELLDPKNDGNLVFKDAAQAKYQEGIAPVDCKTLKE